MMDVLRGGLQGVLVAALLLSSGSLQAEAKMSESAALLAEQLDALGQLHAQFEQRRFDARGIELQRSRGQFWAERPDRFRWEVDEPFAEVLIGDGETLWLWDPDLEQVTIRPYDERLRSTPASLLSGGVDDLLDDFRVRHDDEGERLSFQLEPHATDALFERLELVFDAGSLRWLVIHDGMGQYTEVGLRSARTEFAQDDGRYQFVIPEGVDVLREPAQSGLPDG